MLTEYIARLSWTTLGSLARGRASLLDELVVPCRVWPTDIDVFGHVNNGRYLTLMDLGRTDHSVRTGFLKAAFRHGWKPVLGGATVRFKRELTPGQRYDLKTRLAAWDDKWFFFQHRFMRGETLHAEGFVKGVVKRGRSTVPPAEVFGALGHPGAAPVPPEELRRWMEATA